MSTSYPTSFYKNIPWASVGTVLLGALVLLIPALFNGYPIINSDDGTYLDSGFLLASPIDRPIAYGILLRITSFNGYSLFVPAFAQCWLMSWLINRVFRRTVAGNYYHWYALVTMGFLCFFSSLSWTTSELLPDVLTSTASLCLALILLQQESKWVTGLLFFAFTVCICTHISHVGIFAVVNVLALVFRKQLFLPAALRTGTLYLCLSLVVTFGAIAAMRPALSGSKHVFGMAALLEQGILKPYLDETCPTENYKICAFKDNLNTNANFFLWYPESPVNLTGGWAANKEEYKKIIWGTYTRPKYIAMHIKMSAIFTARQALVFGIDDGNYPVELLQKPIKTWAPTDQNTFLAARQQKRTLHKALTIPNLMIVVVVLASLVVLGYQILIRKGLRHRVTLLLFLSISTIAANLWVCATFGQINDRYGSRVMWMLPLCALISIFARCTKPDTTEEGSAVIRN